MAPRLDLGQRQSRADNQSVDTGLRLRHNFAWTTFGTVVYAASQWLILLVLARLTDPGQVGQLALGLAISAPVIMLTNLSLRSIQATDTEHRFSFGDYLGVRFSLTVAALLAIAAIALLGPYRLDTGLVVIAVGASKGVEAISDVHYGAFQNRSRLDLMSRSMIYRGLLGVALFALAVAVSGRVLIGVLGMACAWLFILFVHDRQRTATLLASDPMSPGFESRPAEVIPNWSWPRLRSLIWLAAPLGLAAALISAGKAVPRLFVEAHLGEYDLGVFAALAYVPVVGGLLVNALGQAASPRLAQRFAGSSIRHYVVLLGILCGFGAFVGAALVGLAVAWGEPAVAMLYGDDYRGFNDVFVWLAVGAAATYIVSGIGYGLTAARAFRIQPVIFGASVLLLSFLCYAWVPKSGLLGASWAMLGASIFQLVALGIVLTAVLITRRPARLSTASPS